MVATASNQNKSRERRKRPRLIQLNPATRPAAMTPNTAYVNISSPQFRATNLWIVRARGMVKKIATVHITTYSHDFQGLSGGGLANIGDK